MKQPYEYVCEWMADMHIPLERAKMYLSTDYNEFMKGNIRIDEDIAKKLELFTNLPQSKWLHIQQQYDNYLAEKANEAARPFL